MGHKSESHKEIFVSLRIYSTVRMRTAKRYHRGEDSITAVASLEYLSYKTSSCCDAVDVQDAALALVSDFEGDEGSRWCTTDHGHRQE